MASPTHHHEEQVQHDVGQTGGDQKIEGALGVAHGPQDAGAHVVEEGGDASGEVDPQVDGGVGQHIGRRAHQPQGGPGGGDPQHGDAHAGGQGQGDGRVDGAAEALRVPGAVPLGDDHRGPRGEPHEEVHQKVDEHRRGATHGGQSLLAHEVAHDDGVHRVVELLEEGAQQDGEEKGQEGLCDGTLRDGILHDVSHLP